MFQRWPKRDPNKHYYLVPNEVFNLGLSSHEIAVYNYLLRCEDRRTYQCHPSYRTIGRAVQLSENTVRKYVAGLEEKGLIRTEPSTIITKDGRVRNGSLIYTIRPIQSYGAHTTRCATSGGRGIRIMMPTPLMKRSFACSSAMNAAAI